MTGGASIFWRTAFLVTAFVLLLCACILLLSFLHGGIESNDDHFLTPDAAVAAPTAQDLLQKKFDAYNTVIEKDGKQAVTIFDEEKITDIRTRRENGEWFWLSSEEMLFLIHDTIKLFEMYDTVYAWSLDGVLNVFDCNVIEEERECAITDVILLRIQALNCAEFTYGSVGALSIFSDIKQPLSDTELKSLVELTNLWKDDTGTKTVERLDFLRKESYAHIHYSCFISEDTEYLRLIEHHYIPLEQS